MNYDEFSKLIPDETKEFIVNALPYLRYYSNENKVLSVKSVEYEKWEAKSYYSKMFFLLIIVLNDINEYAGLLSKYGFSPNNFSIYTNIVKKIDCNEEFKYITSFIPDCKDKVSYSLLTPLDIVLKSLDFYIEQNHNKVFEEVFTRCDDIYQFRKDLRDYNSKYKTIQKQNLEKKLFKDLSFSVVSYLETASKIRNFLLKKNIENITSLSLFWATFYYQDVPLLNGISESQALLSIFEDNSINKDTLDFWFDETRLDKNILFIKEYYFKYIEDLINEGLKKEDIMVSDILNKALDSHYTNEYEVDKLLAKLNVNSKIFNNLKDLVKDRLKLLDERANALKIKNFYDGIDKDTKDFLEFSCKAYQFIINNWENKKDILNTLDDVDILSLFITNCYFECDIYKFFLEYNIDINKILNYLDLELTKENIDSQVLDKKILVERFTKFGYGNNKALKVKDIINNLSNNDFNNSMIIENIFEALTNCDLKKNFTSQLKETLKLKEEKRKQQLEEKLFHNMDVDVIKFLEKTFGIYNFLNSNIVGINDNDLFGMSLIISALNDHYYLEKFMKEMGFNNDKILDFLSLKYIDYDANIEILPKFENFILVKDNKEELTINDILKSAFNKDLVGSVYYAKFLKAFGHTFNDFNDFDIKYQNCLEKFKKDKMIGDMENKIEHFDDEIKDFIKTTLKIHHKLINSSYNEFFITDEDDMIKSSIILALGYLNIKEFEFIKNYGDLNYLLKELQLNEDFFTNLDDEVDYSLALGYSKYFIKEDFKIHDIVLLVLEEENLLKELMSSDNYEKLKKEIIMGKPYELTLTFDERLKLLDNIKVDNIDLKDYSSIIAFGDVLANHSKYLSMMFSQILLNDTHDLSVAKINEMINNLSFKKEENEKKSFFKRFLAIDIEEKKLVINEESVKELIKNIEETLKNLKEEYRQYKELLMYTKIYERKNQQFYDKALEITDSKEEINVEDYNIITNLDYLKEKASRFKTTDLLIKQNLLSIVGAIKTHNVTINALELARDVLIPLVILQLSITKGKENEKMGIELSQDVFSLFQTLLNNNAIGTKENMERLRNSSILNDETIKLLDNNILQILGNSLDNKELVLERKIKTDN